MTSPTSSPSNVFLNAFSSAPATASARLALPQVTLCCVDSTSRLPWALDALRSCLEQIDFGDAFLCTDAGSLGEEALPHGVRWVEIEPLRSIEAYSEFMLQGLVAHVRTSHVLIVQWDGFVLNASAWMPAFLEVDYIGAPWPHLPEPHRVGNGGFSLRSAKLLQAVKGLPVVQGESEDISICVTHRAALEAQGLRFASTAMATAFSVEDGELSERIFGFHAPYHLPKIFSPERTLRLVASMTPAVVNSHYFGSLLRELSQGARERPALVPALRAFEGHIQLAVENMAGRASLDPKVLGVLKALIRYGQFRPARRLLALRRAASGRGERKLSLRLNVNWVLSFLARR